MVDREDREQWPATTVVKAFLEGKIDRFKAYCESYNGDNSEDAKWIKRWTTFIKSLEETKEDRETLKELCSKFMAAQRVQKYRRTKQ